MTEKRGRMSRPAPVADLMDGIFSGKPAAKRLEEGKIWLIWDAAVGRQIAAKARPASIRDGILTVAVASAPWMQQLTYLKKGIVDKVNELLGADLVRDIYLKAGTTQPLSLQSELRRTPARQLTEEEDRRIREQTAVVNDPELREAFARMLASDLIFRTKNDP